MSGKIKINNGRRLEASFGTWSGVAGVQGTDPMHVAFAARARDLRDVKSGTLDGKPVSVVNVMESKVVPGMVVLTVTAVTE